MSIAMATSFSLGIAGEHVHTVMFRVHHKEALTIRGHANTVLPRGKQVASHASRWSCLASNRNIASPEGIIHLVLRKPQQNPPETRHLGSSASTAVGQPVTHCQGLMPHPLELVVKLDGNVGACA